MTQSRLSFSVPGVARFANTFRALSIALVSLGRG